MRGGGEDASTAPDRDSRDAVHGARGLARRSRDSLLNFGRPLELAQARSDAVQSKESARQLEAAASYRTAQKRAAIDAAESRIEEASSKLDAAGEDGWEDAYEQASRDLEATWAKVDPAKD